MNTTKLSDILQLYEFGLKPLYQTIIIMIILSKALSLLINLQEKSRKSERAERSLRAPTVKRQKQK